MKPNGYLPEPDLEWHESDLAEHQRAGLSARWLLRGALICTSVILLGVSVGIWFPAGQRLWREVFPYRGPALFVNTQAGEVFALKPDTGEILWQTPPTALYTFQGIIGPHLLYVTESGNSIIGLDQRTGQPRWHYQANGSALERLSIGGIRGNILYGIESPFPLEGSIPTITVAAFDLDTGKVLFRYEFNSQGAYQATDFFLGADTLYVGGHNNLSAPNPSVSLYALDAQTGAVRWSMTQENTTAISVMQEIDKQALLISQTMVLGDTHLLALQIDNGAPAWQPDVNFNQAFVDQGSWYLVLNHGEVPQGFAAYQTESAVPRWEVPFAHDYASFVSPLIVSDGQPKFFVSWHDHFIQQTELALIDAQTGKTLWQVNNAAEDSLINPTIIDDHAYFIVQGGLGSYDLAGNRLWQNTSFSTDKGDLITSATSSQLYVVSGGNRLSAIMTASGHQLWSRTFKRILGAVASS